MVGASIAVACSDDQPSGDAPEPAREASPGTVRDPDCLAVPSAAAAPEGPSEHAVTLDETEDLRVEAVVHPRPDDGGEPWSQWSQGLALADGRFLSAAGDHRGEDGNAYLYVYDPGSRELTRFADIHSLVGHETGDWGYGKIHAPLVEGADGEVYLATYWGTRRDLTFGGSYTGDWLLRLDPATLEVEPLEVPVARHGIPSLAADPERGMLYGEAVDPESSTRDDEGSFFVYDTSDGEVVRLDDDRLSGFRNVLVADDGTVYLAGPNDRLLVYEPDGDELRLHDERLPGGMLRASTSPGPDGSVYGVTNDPERFFALREDGTIDDLGAARGYTASMALHPDGARFFYVPGAHGDAFEDGTPVVEVDTDTGDQRVVTRLDPLARDELGLVLGGSYNVAVDPSGQRLFVGLNAGETEDDPWGEVVLVTLSGPDVVGDPAVEPPEVSPGTDEPRLDVAWTAPVTEVPDTFDAHTLFRNDTEAQGLVEPLTGMHGHAVAVGDVNGDGWTDVFVGTFADRPAEEYRRRGASGPSPDRLLLGGPDGFEVDESFPQTHGRTSGAAFADLDGDGDLDLVIARNVRDGERQDAPTVVLRNDDGKLTEAAVLDEERSARSVGILDFDGDGLLDVFLVEDRWGEGSSVLLRNTGDFTFEDVTEDAGLPDDVHGLGVATADFTDNGATDVFVSGSNRLFVNTDGTFEEVDSDVFEWDSYGPEDDVAGIAVGDVDRNGRPDLLVGHHYGSTVDDDREVAVRLYLNRGVDDAGHPRFEDVTDDAGLVGLPTKAPHVEIVDLDADGWPDLLTTASAENGTTPAVFRGLGTRDGVPRFEAPGGLGDEQYWVTGATFDADRDGRLDVLLVEWEPVLPSLLLANDGPSGHWLEVQVSPSGADGTGAVVEVFPAGEMGDADALLGSQVITSSTGYGAGSEPVARFGLGDQDLVDVRVDLTDGSTVSFTDVEADRRATVSEGC